MFLAEYHVDGLRLDAVHALVDSSTPHILEELGVEAEAWSARSDRPLSLIAESDLNDPGMFTPREAVFEPPSALAKILTRGFFHDGTLSTFRGRLHGKPIDIARTSNWRLVVANQNHDQIGNRAIGDRLFATLDEHQLGIAAVLKVLGPFTPVLFMGEGWRHRRRSSSSRRIPSRNWDVPPPRPHQWVRPPGLGPGPGSRPARPRDVPAVQARLVGARAPRFAARTAARALSAADAFTPNGAGVHRSRPANPDQPGGGPSSRPRRSSAHPPYCSRPLPDRMRTTSRPARLRSTGPPEVRRLSAVLHRQARPSASAWAWAWA